MHDEVIPRCRRSHCAKSTVVGCRTAVCQYRCVRGSLGVSMHSDEPHKPPGSEVRTTRCKPAPRAQANTMQVLTYQSIYLGRAPCRVSPPRAVGRAARSGNLKNGPTPGLAAAAARHR